MDISKCNGKKCKIKSKCFRYTCSADEHYQQYSEPKYDKGECIYFWSNENMRTTI